MNIMMKHSSQKLSWTQYFKTVTVVTCKISIFVPFSIVREIKLKSAVTCKISIVVPNLYSTRNNFDASSLKWIYHTFIYPNIIYCNSVWGTVAARS